jgi:hypothetical protein
MLLTYVKAIFLLNLAQSNLAGPQKTPIHQQVHNILVKSKKRNYAVTKRRFIENFLHCLAFAKREKFSEPKSSLLVKTWERETGLTW